MSPVLIPIRFLFSELAEHKMFIHFDLIYRFGIIRLDISITKDEFWIHFESIDKICFGKQKYTAILWVLITLRSAVFLKH